MTDQPTSAVEATMHAVYAALAQQLPARLERRPVFGHWEDEELGFPPLYEQLTVTVELGGWSAHCNSSRDGAAIDGLFSTYHDARDPAGPHALVFAVDERAALREHGWHGVAPCRASWAAGDPAPIVAAFRVLASLSPRVLLPEDLPPGSPWPWPRFIDCVLLAEVIGSEGSGAGRILVTRTDDELHRVVVAEGSPEDAMWREWSAKPPVLRRLSQWRR
ncbi:hypothetical protein [Nannocystis sp. SCPEA4]|uniref:hypothetical protein n=1 Tax=Nannocystis sp. SCPEA4 TaxID=2996787 RepID=UPI002270475F|nr:hypothetical protein [Nannocystis sp. SCPEA4]MCY1059555.1 hypothetical protein [Nannocystis sp. SCPEA4]